jgi:hypothetical protein
LGYPSANLYQAILQNQAIAIQALEENKAPASPARRMLPAVVEHRSPKVLPAPRAQSPFSSPIRIPRTFSARTNAVAASSRQSFRLPELTAQSDAAVSSEEEGGEETTPIAIRRLHPQRDQAPTYSMEDVQMEVSAEQTLVRQPVKDRTQVQDDMERKSPEVDEQTPVKPQRARKSRSQVDDIQPRRDTRRRGVSVADSVEENEQKDKEDRVPAPKPARRTRAKQAPIMEPYVSIMSPTPPKRTRRQASTAVSVDHTGSTENDTEPAAKRARRAVATPSQKTAPPPVKRTARQTRSQSVMSEATTDGGDETTQARNLRRSGRLSSVVPSSPIKRTLEAEGAGRTRRATSRQPSEGPSKLEPARTRRQGAKK